MTDFDMATREPRTIKQRDNSAVAKRMLRLVIGDVDGRDGEELEFKLTEIAELALQRDYWHVWVTLPAKWSKGDGYGGRTPDDPAMLYVCLNRKGSADDPIRWSIPLSDVVADAVECRADVDFDVDRDNLDMMRHCVKRKDAGPLIRIRDRLREIADKIDLAIVDHASGS
jgi:hypothetical protein